MKKARNTVGDERKVVGMVKPERINALLFEQAIEESGLEEYLATPEQRLAAKRLYDYKLLGGKSADLDVAAVELLAEHLCDTLQIAQADSDSGIAMLCAVDKFKEFAIEYQKENSRISGLQPG